MLRRTSLKIGAQGFSCPEIQEKSASSIQHGPPSALKLSPVTKSAIKYVNKTSTQLARFREMQGQLAKKIQDLTSELSSVSSSLEALVSSHNTQFILPSIYKRDWSMAALSIELTSKRQYNIQQFSLHVSCLLCKPLTTLCCYFNSTQLLLLL